MAVSWEAHWFHPGRQHLIALRFMNAMWPNGIIFHQPRFPWNKGISLTITTIWGKSVVWGRYNLTMPCGHSRTNQYPTTSWKENPAKVLQFRYSDIPFFISNLFLIIWQFHFLLAPPHKINLFKPFHFQETLPPKQKWPSFLLTYHQFPTHFSTGTSLLKGGLFWPCFGSPGLAVGFKTLWTKPSIWVA